MARSPSTSTMRTASAPSPAMRTAFSIDECVSARDVDGGPLGLDAVRARCAPPLARCSAASRATRLAPELESWMTPPPVPVERNDAGRPEQVGQPVHDVLLELGAAGLVAQSMPCTPRPAETRSPSTDGPGGVGREVAEEAGVLPVRDARAGRRGRGRRGRRRTARPARARAAGRAARTSPGATCERTGKRPDPRPVVGDPVDDLVAVLPELLGRHVRSGLGHPGPPYRRAERGPEGPPRASGRETKTLGREPPREAAGRSWARRLRDERRDGLNAAGERHVAAVSSGGRQSHSAPGATRTHTARVLNPLPLPIGVRGRAGVPGSPSSLAARCADARRR